jgi:hydroxymethylpyrimidine pyrophosphatase-like HAD family hydrolase
MIAEAGMGIAMTNATEAVKKAATTITLYDNDHDGLARTIIDMM